MNTTLLFYGFSMKTTPIISIYFIFLFFVVGLVMGSALNCLSWRIAKKEKWTNGRSRCPSCGHKLMWYELIPLFSWLFQRGHCRHCHEPISRRYPITEAVLGVVYFSILLRFDLSFETLLYLILCSCLFCLSLVDLDTMEIPNRFLIIPAVTKIIYNLITSGFGGLWNCIWHALVLGGGMLLLSLAMDKLLHKESMGGGDIKLLAMLGLYFNLIECLLLLICSCIIGILFALLSSTKKGVAFPFGPAISVAALLVLLAGSPIVQWYLHFL